MRPAASGRSNAFIFAASILAAAVLFTSCSEGEDLVLDENIEGFFLGETLKDFKERIGHVVAWTEIPNPPHDQRGMMIAVTGTPSRSREIEMSRLTFDDDRLVEIVLYYKRTSYSQLMTLHDRLEQHFGARATSPDGTKEMAYKTYWIQGPGMSVTIRRITKKPETELYVQYHHNELMRRKKEKKDKR